MMNEPMIDASAKALMEHAGFVRALARSILFDQDAAEDVTQEALLAALKRGGLGKLSLRAWLGRVARNLSLRENRGVGRRRRREQRSAYRRPWGPVRIAENRGGDRTDPDSVYWEPPPEAVGYLIIALNAKIQVPQGRWVRFQSKGCTK